VHLDRDSPACLIVPVLPSVSVSFPNVSVTMPSSRAVHWGVLFIAFGLVTSAGSHVNAEEPKLTLGKGNRIVLIGNTLAERMQYFGNWETLLHSRFPELELVVRNLGWSADELTLRPRSQDFKDHGHRLEDHKPDVVIAMFGFNESFAGPKGLAKFWQSSMGTWKSSSRKRPAQNTTARVPRN
jgi:hypothetical protein